MRILSNASYVLLDAPTTTNAVTRGDVHRELNKWYNHLTSVTYMVSVANFSGFWRIQCAYLRGLHYLTTDTTIFTVKMTSYAVKFVFLSRTAGSPSQPTD